MNILATYHYQLGDHKKTIAIYYLVILGLSALLLIFFGAASPGNSTAEPEGSITVGFEGATIIFLFVVGLCTFKETFLMMAQNGISRKTLFVGKLLTMATVAAFMAIVDKIIFLIAHLLSAKGGGLQVWSLYEQFFSNNLQGVSAVGVHLEGILFEFSLAMAVMAIGYFITVMFYRLGKVGKVIVGAGVPVFLLIILPILDSNFFNNVVFNAVAKLSNFMWQSPVHAVSMSLVGFVLFSGLAYILMRRAVVKE